MTKIARELELHYRRTLGQSFILTGLSFSNVAVGFVCLFHIWFRLNQEVRCQKPKSALCSAPSRELGTQVT